MKTSAARLYVAKRRANPIVSSSGLQPGSFDDAATGLLVDVPERLGLQVGGRLPVRLVRRRLRADTGLAQQVGERGVEPRAQVDAVRDVADRRGASVAVGPEPRPHLAGDLAVELGDAVREAGEPEREGRQAEARLLAGAPELEQRRAVDAGRGGEPADVALDELLAEDLVPGRHGRVRREDRRPADVLDRVTRRRPLLDERAQPLDREERRVALVHVEDARLDTERGQRPHAADAEQELLPDAVLAVAAVERIGQPLHLEQVERDRADVLPPDRRGDRLAREVDLDGDGLAHEACGLRIDGLVLLGLPPGRVQALREVAAAVEEADADERDAELGGALEVVAREDAEAAGVDRQRLLDAELHAEVGDEQPRGVIAVSPLPPGR